MNIILLGAPGAGKGTQAENISQRLGIPIIGTGHIIREAIAKGTPAGRQAGSFSEEGALVPDPIVLEMVRDRLKDDDCINGFIFDGFPRTVIQAEALDKMGIPINVVLAIDVADDVIIQRLSGRRVCDGCGVSYHLDYNPSKSGAQCEHCGGTLVVRADDSPQTVAERLRVYHEQTELVYGYYEKQGKVKTVKGQEEVADTTALVFRALGV